MPRDYKVGYAKPPERTRFKTGRSGNPKGRPKATLNLTTELAAELSEIIPVRENGTTRRVTKQKALVKTLVAKGLQGDVKAIHAVLALNTHLLSDAAERDPNTFDADEVLILKRFAPQALQRAKKRGKAK